MSRPCRHEPVVMAKGANIPVLSRKNWFVTGVRFCQIAAILALLLMQAFS